MYVEVYVCDIYQNTSILNIKTTEKEDDDETRRPYSTYYLQVLWRHVPSPLLPPPLPRC